MVRAIPAGLALVALSLVGCASSPPPPRPSARPFDDVRRVIVVPSGTESAFAVVEYSSEPGRTFDEILKWISWSPYQAVLRPAALLVHRGINWALEADRAATATSRLQGLSPRSVVGESMARTLETTGWFDEVRFVEREPAAEERRRADAIVRVAVPTWGLVRVRDVEAGLLSCFADVRGRAGQRLANELLYSRSAGR